MNKNLLGIMIAANALMNLGQPPEAPDIEGVMPDTSDVARRFLERERHQQAKFPSRKKRLRTKRDKS